MFGMELKGLERALDGLSTRFSAQSNNVANINTPNYQRQVVNFEDSLKSILDTAQDGVATDSFQGPSAGGVSAMQGFFGQPSPDAEAMLELWSPTVSTIENKAHRRDGNGSSIETEMADVVKTVQRFNTVTTMLASEYRTLKFVIDQK